MRWKTIDFTLNKMIFYAFYFLDGFLTTDIIKRSLTAHELICKHPNTPDISPTIISISLNNLRTNVVESSTVSLPPIRADSCPSKVAYLADSLGYDKNTLDMTTF